MVIFPGQASLCLTMPDAATLALLTHGTDLSTWSFISYLEPAFPCQGHCPPGSGHPTNTSSGTELPLLGATHLTLGQTLHRTLPQSLAREMHLYSKQDTGVPRHLTPCQRSHGLSRLSEAQVGAGGVSSCPLLRWVPRLSSRGSRMQRAV